MSNGLPISFNLLMIKTDQFALMEKNFSKEDDIQLESNLNYKISPKTNGIGCFLTLSYVQKEKPFIHISVSCHFIIEKESWDLHTHKNKSALSLPKEFLAHLAMITLGTARGVLHSKTEGTEFNKLLVPILDVTQMATSDITFVLDK